MRWLCSVLRWCLLGSMLTAAGGSSSIELEWRAPEGCPSGAQVLAEARKLLRGSPTQEPHTPIRIQGNVRNAGGRWRLLLRTSQGEVKGERRLDAASCRALGEATALILALMVDPEALSRPVEPPAPAEPPPRPATPEPPPQPVVPEPAPPAPSPASAVPAPVAPPAPEVAVPPSAPQPFLALGALAEEGALPGSGTGLRLDGGVDWAHLRLSLGGHFLLPRTTVVPGLEGAQGSLRAWAAALRGAWVVKLAPVRLYPMVGGEVGRMSASTSGVSEPGSADAWWVALSGGAGGSVAVTPWLGVRLEAEVAVPLYRPRFFVEGLGTFHQPRLLSGRFSALLEVRP
jgi:hypothetical protein